MKKWTLRNMPDLSGKVAIVTGANTGIGFEKAKALAIKGATTIMACRSRARAEAALLSLEKSEPAGKMIIMTLDLSSLESIEAFVQDFSSRFSQLDMLINNAGVMVPPFSRTKEGFELQFGTNHLGHFVLTGKLLPFLEKSDDARIVNVSSMAGKMGGIQYDDPNYENRTYDKWQAYCQSKVSNLVFTKELLERLSVSGSKVKVFSAHPGWTSTDLQRHTLLARIMNPLFAMKSWQGALPALFAATSDEAVPGKFYGPHGFMEMRGYPVEVNIESRRNKSAFSPENKNRLWSLSEKMTGFRWPLLQQ